MFVIYPFVCLCCDSAALLPAGQTGAQEKQLMLSQLSVMLFRVRNSITDESSWVPLISEYLFLTKITMCLRTGFCWLDLACICPFLCARSTAVDWLAHSLRILEASGSNVGTDPQRMFWLRFFVLYLSLCTQIERHIFSLDPHRFPSAPIFLSFCPLSTIPFDLSHLHLVPMFKMSRAIYTSLYACMAWTKMFLLYFTKW